jgi:hypothetical protein
MMHEHKKSDSVIVAVKRANKGKEAHCGGGRSGVGGATAQRLLDRMDAAPERQSGLMSVP